MKNKKELQERIDRVIDLIHNAPIPIEEVLTEIERILKGEKSNEQV